MSIHFTSEKVKKYSDLAESIKKNLVVNDNVIKENEPHSAYLSNLPEGVTSDHIEKITKYNSRFVTAAHIAVGEMAAEVFKKDSKVDNVQAEIGYFGKNDSINISVDRTKEYQNHLAKNPEDQRVVKHLVMTTTINSTSSKGTSLKAVKDEMSQEFAGMFNK